MATRNVLITTALIVACLSGMAAPAQANTAAVAPATSARITAETPITGIETPQQAATRQYTRAVALDILTGNAALGRPVPKASVDVDLSDPTVARLVAAHKAKAYNTSGGIRRDASGIMYGTISYQNGLLIVNPTNAQVQHVNEYTGGTYVLAGNSGTFAWVPNGGIGEKWRALKGAAVVGLPTSPEVTGVAGVHVGALKYASQTFAKNGAESDIMWTSKYGAHHVKGAIRKNYLDNAGARTQGVPITDEIVNADKSVTQRFERVSITWYPGGKIVRK